MKKFSTIEYHREPTQAEIRRGYGETHYIDIPTCICLHHGKPKKWVKYNGMLWYY